jgi:uncharacterized OsmC-like protein
MQQFIHQSTILLGLLLLLASPLISQDLITIKINSELSQSNGRSIVNARNHFLIVDSPPPLGGPNEEINPIEMLLSALGSCGVLVSDKVARELDIPLKNASATVEGILDPRGVKGEDINPRIQEFKIKLTLTGVSKKQANKLADAIKKRCPVYTTLERSAPIELEVELKKK